MGRTIPLAWPFGVVLVLILFAAMAKAEPADDRELWFHNNIEPGADVRIALDESGATFLRKVGSTPLIVTARRTGYRNIWVRFEPVVPMLRGPASYYSVLSMKSYDCAQHRVRAATTLYYAEHNLTGRSQTVNRAGDWLYIADGTADAAILEIACGRARLPR